MKVLYIAHYREKTGWGEFAKNQILALDSVGVDVVPRYIKLNDVWADQHPRIAELEKKNAEGCDVVIQCLLPHHYQYQGGMKNIGVFFIETDDFTWSPWVSQINLLDEAWVPNVELQKVCAKSGVTIPVKVVPPSLDISKYEIDYPIINDLVKATHGDFLFYFIGEFTKRKNLSGLLRAFHTEFGKHEPVNLVIKTNKYGWSQEKLREQVVEITAKVKQGLRLYPREEDYITEIIIDRHLTEQQMGSLHKTCDCLVAPSFGEALGLVVLDAMGFGNQVIASGAGPKQYMGTGCYVPCVQPDECFGVDLDTFPFLMTARETWGAPDIGTLRKSMRYIYETTGERRRQASEMNKNMIKAFSYEQSGKQLAQYLQEDG